MLVSSSFRYFAGQGDVHLGGKIAALTGVRFVYDDGEGVALMGIADFIKNERKFLDCGNDDLLACLNGARRRSPACCAQ